MNSTKDQTMSADFKHSLISSFKTFKGLKFMPNIKERYKIGQLLGEGSFGQVRLAMHRQAEVKCAIKIIKKEKINEHQVLQDLMANEL